MERLNTAADILAKLKRTGNFTANNPALEEIFDFAFYCGMTAFNEFMRETSALPSPDNVEQLKAMEDEIKEYLKPFA